MNSGTEEKLGNGSPGIKQLARVFPPSPNSFTPMTPGISNRPLAQEGPLLFDACGGLVNPISEPRASFGSNSIDRIS
jgi:hypothetical protein